MQLLQLPPTGLTTMSTGTYFRLCLLYLFLAPLWQEVRFTSARRYREFYTLKSCKYGYHQLEEQHDRQKETLERLKKQVHIERTKCVRQDHERDNSTAAKSGKGPMYGAAAANASGPPARFSPITLSADWAKLEKLLIILVCACIGSTMNGFFVASFFVEHTLKKIGNVFLACIGMADLVLTTGVMPVAAVVLLSGEWDDIPVCKSLHFLTEVSTYCYSLFFGLVSVENYCRICRSPSEYEVFISMRIGLVSVIIFIFSVSLSATGVYLDLDFDYCERRHFGDYYYRMTTGIIFHYIPFFITVCGLLLSAFRIRRRAREQMHYKRSQQYERDSSITCLNITAFILYVGGWTPYLVITYEYPLASNKKFYHWACVGIFRSVLTSMIYSVANRSFRRAYAHLFNYCCCKSTLSGTFATRHRRAMDYKPASGDVRVHIMHKAVNASSPQRAASSSRETQEL